MTAEVCKVNLLEHENVPKSGLGGGGLVPQNSAQGGGSRYGCSQVETVEITHYPSSACVAVCSHIDGGDVFSDAACTAGNGKLISALFLFNLLPPPLKYKLYRIFFSFFNRGHNK